MIRYSEVVLKGHPDKFCDQVADAILEECYRADQDAYCQVEVGICNEQVWLSGGTATRMPLKRSPEEIVRDVARRVGYGPPHSADPDRIIVADHICIEVDCPLGYTRHVNDQCIVTGWAGYDERVRWLPPEHFLAHSFREAIEEDVKSGRLAGHGPDGKILVRLREESGRTQGEDRWTLEQVLITLQHPPDVDLLSLGAAIVSTLGEAYGRIRQEDPRWSARWEHVEILSNPNGPLLIAGSLGDNGQTGRKLVMDYYGPRIPIGGGALSGKDLAHIDRAGAYAAREAALNAVRTGAWECLVRVAYAPNMDEPLDVSYEMVGRGDRKDRAWFAHSRAATLDTRLGMERLGAGTHFWVPILQRSDPVREDFHAGPDDRAFAGRGQAEVAREPARV